MAIERLTPERALQMARHDRLQDSRRAELTRLKVQSDTQGTSVAEGSVRRGQDFSRGWRQQEAMTDLAGDTWSRRNQTVWQELKRREAETGTVTVDAGARVQTKAQSKLEGLSGDERLRLAHEASARFEEAQLQSRFGIVRPLVRRA